MTGMLRSMNTRSGRTSRYFSSASSPFAASATTFSPGSVARNDETPARMRWWSSAVRIRIVSVICTTISRADQPGIPRTRKVGSHLDRYILRHGPSAQPPAPRMKHQRSGFLVTISARVAITCAFIHAAGPVARAQRPSPAIGELDHVTWTIRDGAPSSAYALTQSADGVLWIGTTTGLYQFDGVRFELFEPPSGVAMPSLNVSALVAAPDGKLWIGYSRGGASVLVRGQLVSFGEGDGMPAGGVTALAVDSVGDIWAATSTGLGRFRNDGWQRIGPESG